MAELKIERIFAAPPARVFAFVTQPEYLAAWWGPEGMTLPDTKLDFTAPGPWHSVMQNAEGQKFTVSGQVTSIKKDHSVGFTWAWHDENGTRGDESHVLISLTPTADGGTAFTLHHRQLATEESATNHNGGWTSSLRKLERLAA